MKTVQQWIDEYLSPEERERFVKTLKERDPDTWRTDLSWPFPSLMAAIDNTTIFWYADRTLWMHVAERTEPYKTQRPVIGTPLNWND